MDTTYFDETLDSLSNAIETLEEVTSKNLDDIEPGVLMQIRTVIATFNIFKNNLQFAIMKESEDF